MVLAMSRPSRHPKTGIFWVRKRVPTDLVARVGRAIEYFSLQTREPAEAKQRHAEAIARFEARWTELRRAEAAEALDAAIADTAGRSLSEREAGDHAQWMFAHWLGLRITPEAGTVKTKQAREVPLHPQLVELGFPAFVEGVRTERIFLIPDA